MKRPLYRTGEYGENPDWMCKPCIIKNHDKSLIDKGTDDFTQLLFNTINKIKTSHKHTV